MKRETEESTLVVQPAQGGASSDAGGPWYSQELRSTGKKYNSSIRSLCHTLKTFRFAYSYYLDNFFSAFCCLLGL